MIHKIPYSEIDFDKYDSCISGSSYPVIYAQSWFLRALIKSDWEVLMYNDYEAVMPITRARMKKSLWKKSIIPPYFCQQLGVFFQKTPDSNIFNMFYESFLKLNPVVYHFNHANSNFIQNQNNIRLRTNYVLDIRPDYSEIFKNYSTSKRQTVRNALRNNLEIIELDDSKEFLQFFHKHQVAKESFKIQQMRNSLISELIKRKSVEMYFVKKEEEIIATALFAFYQDRIYYLNSASTTSGRKFLAMHFLIDFVIQKYAGKYNYFDFEGSEIPGVAEFMKSFGAENQSFAIWA
ncbi:MAG: GNAT family N-acetyltransferase [Flavobacteriaceae bacterium]|nr:GNAT family N-acetyltransferase [Flavobacteriaceae bacterium]